MCFSKNNYKIMSHWDKISSCKKNKKNIEKSFIKKDSLSLI